MSPSSNTMQTRSIFKAEQELSLIEKVEPVIDTLGFRLRDLEILGIGAQTIIRVTLDPLKGASADTHRDGIGIEDCSNVHKLLSPMFDVWDPLPHAYSLEVASPGEKPTLRTLEHFKEAVGQKVHFQTREAIEMPAPMKPRRNWEGLLESADDEGVVKLKDGYGEHAVPLSKIKTAQWLREWTVREDDSKGKKKKF